MTQRRDSPTVKRRRVAATLRDLRKRADMTMAEAARRAEHDSTWLSRIEHAENGIHNNDLRQLLSVYGIEGVEVEAVLEINRGARKRGWWHPYSKAIPDWFSTYVGLESEASLIRTYEAQSVPGILQTESYARAVLQAAPIPESVGEIERQVRLRMERQAILDGDDPPQLRAILDEGVVRRIVGDSKIMREQLEYLLTRSSETNIDLMVLPFSAGAHAGFDGPFVLLEFPALPEPYPDTAEPRVVYVDYLTGAHYLEEPAELVMYNAAWDRLAVLADAPSRSRDVLRTIAESLT